MKLQRLILIVPVSVLSTVFASEVWQLKPYMEWTEQEAIALLTNSPWAISQPVRARAPRLDPVTSVPREGSGTCIETTAGTLQEGAEKAVEQTAASASALSSGPRFYTVRFVSAQPIRMAIARWAVLNGRITPEQAQMMLNQDTYNGKLVVSLSASNDQDWAELNSFSTEALEENNYLSLEKSGKKIFAERYVPPVESGIGEALFYFSRTAGEVALITTAEERISFNCRISERTQFRREFKLRNMMMEGELSI